MTAIKSYFLESEICSVYIKADNSSVKEIILSNNDTALKNRFTKESSTHLEFPLKKVIERLSDYLNGKRTDFDFECDLSGYTELEKKILNVVKGIPYSQTMTYEEVAEKIGNKNLRRIVGRTMSKNRFPIIIPCHRVLGKGGQLTGFSADGGIALKEKLLKLERAL